MRKKNFDEKEVLLKIAEVFCANGLEGSSYEMMTQATGVAKQSLVNAFGDKREMLVKALAVSAASFQPAEVLLNCSLKASSRILGFFEEVLKKCSAPGDGCLVSQTLLEKGSVDMQLCKIASKSWNCTRLLLQEVLEVGKGDGSFNSSLNSKTVAYALMGVLSGFRISQKTILSEEELSESILFAVKSIIYSQIS